MDNSQIWIHNLKKVSGIKNWLKISCSFMSVNKENIVLLVYIYFYFTESFEILKAFQLININ
jgi:hypothetical protein